MNSRGNRTVVLCTCVVLLSGGPLNPVVAGEQPQPLPTDSSDGKIASLLMDIELALMSGKQVSLDLSDKLIEAQTLAPTASLSGRRMLQDFPDRLQQDQERLPRDDGDETRSINLRVFGSVAAQYIDNTTIGSDQPAPPIDRQPEQVAIATPTIPPPQPEPPVITPPAPAPVPQSAPSAQPAPSPMTVTPLVDRGDAMLAIGDIAAARLLFRRAADLGSGQAAMKLANTYDPSFISAHKIIGIQPDRATAAIWYRKAIALGESKAQERFVVMVQQIPH